MKKTGRQRQKLNITLDREVIRQMREVCGQLGIPISRFIEGLVRLIVDPSIKDDTPEMYIRDSLEKFYAHLASQGRADLSEKMREEMEKQLKIFDK
jgi:hypothetical protein